MRCRAPPPTDRELKLYGGVCWCDRDRTTINWNGTLPVDNMLALLVQCLLVFSPSWWAIMKPTCKELASAFDISEGHIPREYQIPLNQSSHSRKRSHKMLPFLGSTRRWLPSEMLGIFAPHQVTPVPRDMGGSPLPFSPTVTWPNHELPEWSGSTEVATRVDNAQVPMYLWNDRY